MDLLRRGRRPARRRTPGRWPGVHRAARPARHGQARGRAADGHALAAPQCVRPRSTRDPSLVLTAAAETAALLLDPLDVPNGLVVVSPSPALHQLPWALLPHLHDREFVVAPSAGLWRRSRARPPARAGTRPGGLRPWTPLGGRGGPRRSPLATPTHGSWPVIERRSAPSWTRCATSTSPTSSAMETSPARTRCSPHCAWPTVRCSCTTSNDCRRPQPWSCCRRARPASTPTPAGNEILGLAASLLAAGPRAVIAATVAVPDTSSTVDFMKELHRQLAAGTGPAEALRRARRVDVMIGGAFACHGAN